MLADLWSIQAIELKRINPFNMFLLTEFIDIYVYMYTERD